MRKGGHTVVSRTLKIAALIGLAGLGAGRAASAADSWCWIDAATGKPIITYPPGTEFPMADPNHVSIPGTGRNFVRVPCPPPPASSATASVSPGLVGGGWTGGYLGGELMKNWGRVRTMETSAATGAITNQFSDSGDPFFGGINVGYDWQPWRAPIVIGAVLDADLGSADVRHNFGGGTFIGSSVIFTASAQLRAGVLVMPDLLLYAHTGVAVADQRLQINFGGPVTNQTQFTPGYALGAGIEWRLPGKPIPGVALPLSLFASYEHTWWGDASLHAPAASPLFNYTWSREQDTVTIGVRIHF